ncbi:hypothetical protein MRX96_019068 [Rhipicephalus microplus]
MNPRFKSESRGGARYTRQEHAYSWDQAQGGCCPGSTRGGGWRKQRSEASRSSARPPATAAVRCGYRPPRSWSRPSTHARGITCRSLGIRELRFFPPLCARRGD